MANIEDLGFNVDTGGLKAGADAIDQVTKAGQGLSTSLTGVEASAEKAKTGISQYTRTLQENAAAQARLNYASSVNSLLGVRDEFGGASRAQDVAAYGAELDRLRSKYNPLFALQKQYREELREINAATRAGALSEKERATALASTKTVFAEQVKILQDGGDKTRTSFEGQQRALRALAMDVMLVSPAMGSLAGQIAMLYVANSRLFSSWGQLKQGMMSFFTPMRLLIGGFAAAGVGALALFKFWKDDALALDDLGRRVNVTATQLKNLRDLGGNEGIASSEFGDAMTKFSEQVYQAKAGLGGLFELFRVNGGQAKDFVDYLARAADMVRNARTEEERYNIIRQAGLPATAAWVRYLSQGGDVLRRSVSAHSEVDAAEQRLIENARKFDKMWDTAWTNIIRYTKDAIVKIIEAMNSVPVPAWMKIGKDFDKSKSLKERSLWGMPSSDFEQKLKDYGMGRVQQLVKPSGAGSDYVASGGMGVAPGGYVDPEKLARQIQLEQARYGILGQTMTIEQQMRQLELQISESRANISGSEKKKLEELLYARVTGLDQIKAQIDSLNTEAATFAMTTGAATAYRIEQERINQAMRDGQPLNARQLTDLHNYSIAAGQAAQRLEDMREVSQTMSGFFKDFTGALRQGKDAWEAFGIAANNVLNKLLDRLVDMAVNNVVQAALGGNTGGGIMSSLLSSFFGGGSVAGTSANGGWAVAGQSAASVKFGRGGYTGDGGVNDPAGIVHGQEFVFDAAATRRIGLANLEAMRRGDPIELPSADVSAPSGSSTAGGGAKTIVQVNNYAGGDTETKQRRESGPGGERIIIDIVKKAMARGDMDDVQRGRFSTRPRKVI